jgi:hypothetical protein
MRKKVERLERRDREKTRKAEQSKLTDNSFSESYKSNLHELDKMEKQEDEWKAVRKNPVTKVVVIVGVTIGLVYVSSFIFHVATKAATSYKKFRKVLES